MTLNFECPKCGLALQQHQASQGFFCANKHHFDRHEQGYWVFMAPKRQKPTGDSRQQMRAKRFLLASGIFTPLIDNMATMIATHIPRGACLLDYQCAEGFYLRALSAKLADIDHELALEYVGISDAENAIFAAAKAETPAMLCLNASKKLPFADNSVDFITLIDTPLKGKEYIRVLNKQGYALLVLPGVNHLSQLKRFVYPEVTDKPFHLNLPSELTVVATQPLNFSLQVTAEQALTLLDMQSYAWRATDKIKHEIAQIGRHDLQAAFMLVLAQRTGAQ